MSSSDVVFGSRPIGGLAALSGAVLFTIFDVLSILLFAKKENFSVIAATGSYALFVRLSLLTLVLIQVGLVGLYVPHSAATGVLGLVGFLVTFLGMALAAGSYWAQGFVAPAAAQTAPEFLDDEPAWLNCGFTLTLALLSLGWLLFGVAMLRARIYPRIAAILLMIGAVVSFLPPPRTELVLIVAIAWVGLRSLCGERRRTGRAARTCELGKPAGVRSGHLSGETAPFSCPPSRCPRPSSDDLLASAFDQQE